MINLNLQILPYKFSKKPLLVGGIAMEYYGLRKSGEDIDLIVPEKDVIELIRLFPNRVKDLFGDLGVCPFNFEIWRTICLFNYDDLKENSIEEDNYLIISLEKLLLMKALAMKKEKYLQDTYLLSDRINKDQWKHYDKVKKNIEELLKGVPDISYIEKLGN